MDDFGVAEGMQALALAGPPPHTMAGLCRWMMTFFGVWLAVSDGELPRHIAGCYKRWRDATMPELKGVVQVRPGIADWWYVALHELGHHLSGCEVGHMLNDDGFYHSLKWEERAADACAAVLAIDQEALRVALFEERRDLAACAALFGVPQRIVRLRCTQIGWPRPLNLAWAGICDWEPC